MTKVNENEVWKQRKRERERESNGEKEEERKKGRRKRECDFDIYDGEIRQREPFFNFIPIHGIQSMAREWTRSPLAVIPRSLFIALSSLSIQIPHTQYPTPSFRTLTLHDSHSSLSVSSTAWHWEHSESLVCSALVSGLFWLNKQSHPTG